MDIIDEAFLFFRVNVLFKNFEIKGPGDKVLVYLFVLLSHLFKCVDQVYIVINLGKISQMLKRDWAILCLQQSPCRRISPTSCRTCWKTDRATKEISMCNT